MSAVFLQAFGGLPSPSPSPTLGANLFTGAYVCSVMIWSPLVMAVITAVLPDLRGRYDRVPFWIAFWTAMGVLILNFLAYFQFETFGTVLQLEEKQQWLPGIGVGYHLGLDGTGMCLLLLSSIVSLAAVVASWPVRTRTRAYFVLMLFLQAAVNGVVCSRDLFVTALFLSAAVIPAGLLVLGWSGAARERAGARLLGYWGLGAAAVWLAVLVLYAGAGGAGFDMDVLSKTSLPVQGQLVSGIAALAGAACFLGIVPLHGGLKVALAEAPRGVALLLAGSVSRLGALVLMRIVLLCEPSAAGRLAAPMAGLAAATALYAGILALAEIRARGDVRRAGALLALLPGAVTLMAIAGETPLAYDGAIFAMFAGGLAAALLVVVLATATESSQSRSLSGLGGTGQRAPILTWLIVLAALGLLGFPGFGSYLAGLMTVLGSIHNQPAGTIGVLLGLMLGAVALGTLVWAIAFGPPAPDAPPPREIDIQERWYLAVLVTGLIWVGVVPSGPKVANVPLLDQGFVNVMNASTSDQAAPYVLPVAK